MSGITGFLSRDDWIYAFLLVSTFGVAFAHRFVPSSHYYSVLHHSGGIVGFLAAVLILGWKIVYSIPVAIFSYVAIKYTPMKYNSRMPLFVFVSVFSYLLVVRHLHSFVNISELASQANAVQLLITLRAIGLAFEVSDGRINRTNPGKLKPRRYLSADPSTFDIFNYFYHYCGLFTGPYYTFQVLSDSFDPAAAPFHARYQAVGLYEEVKKRLMTVLWSMPLFITLNHFYPLDGLRTDEVFEWSLLYRLYYAAMVFTVFRMRVYSAWAVSECVCVTLNIGIYPKESKPRIVVGPTDLEKFKENWTSGTAEHDSETTVNIEVGLVEGSEGFRAGVRGWNRSVQSWLALFVHSRSPGSIRMVLTMFVSALWHGTYAGYFMSFLVVPMCTAAEDILFRIFPKDEHGQRNKIFSYSYFLLIRCRGFDMMATGFLLKNLRDTHRFWSALYYWLPITMVILIVVAGQVERMFFRKKRDPPPSETKTESESAKEPKKDL